MKDECLICGAPLVYLDKNEMMVLPFCHMHGPEIVCSHSSKNNQCIGRRCPFSKAGCPD